MAETALITLPLPRPEVLLVRKKKTVLRVYVDNRKEYFIAKRVLDVTLAVLVIAGILSWLLPLLALMIKCTSKGPAFFLQKRTGRGGKSFICYKLRTLPYNLAGYTNSNVEATSRVGQFLRQSHLDELPQFVNVLLGHMSIVGPRPHMHSDCNAFAQLIMGYKFRNLVKPGITGLAQVKGYHGKITTVESVVKRYEWDVYYVCHASIWMDIRIMFNTALQRIGYLLMIKVRKK